MNLLAYARNAFGGGSSPTVEDRAREFFAQSAIRVLLEKSGAEDEDFMRSEMLLIFDTRWQHTWLVATNRALYCIVDSRRHQYARKIWHIPRRDLETDGKITVNIEEFSLSDRENYLVIDGKRPRRYTRYLFTVLSIQDSVKNMLLNALRL